jgi:hypothetical protein
VPSTVTATAAPASPRGAKLPANASRTPRRRESHLPSMAALATGPPPMPQTAKGCQPPDNEHPTSPRHKSCSARHSSWTSRLPPPRRSAVIRSPPEDVLVDQEVCVVDM